MENRMNKEQVIEATINVLSEISVPVRLKEQISDPISGAIMNLAIVLQMIQAENEANAQRTADPDAQKEAGEPIVLTPEAVGCPEENTETPEPISLFGEEAKENGREADTK